MFSTLFQHIYGNENAEDRDRHPDSELDNQNDQPQATIKQEEEALKKLLASRQTFEHQVDCYEKLRRSLQHQEEKRAKENR